MSKSKEFKQLRNDLFLYYSEIYRLLELFGKKIYPIKRDLHHITYHINKHGYDVTERVGNYITNTYLKRNFKKVVIYLEIKDFNGNIIYERCGEHWVAREYDSNNRITRVSNYKGYLEILEYKSYDDDTIVYYYNNNGFEIYNKDGKLTNKELERKYNLHFMIYK